MHFICNLQSWKNLSMVCCMAFHLHATISACISALHSPWSWGSSPHTATQVWQHQRFAGPIMSAASGGWSNTLSPVFGHGSWRKGIMSFHYLSSFYWAVIENVEKQMWRQTHSDARQHGLRNVLSLRAPRAGVHLQQGGINNSSKKAWAHSVFQSFRQWYFVSYFSFSWL